MRWPDFAERAPELAEHGWRLLAERHGYAYLATTAPDGGPRIHPVAPIRADRGLFVAVRRNSPKLADLLRDPRMALHTTVRPPDDEEFALRGVVIEISSPRERETAVAGATDGARLSDRLALFETDVREVAWARWSDGAPIRKRWRT
jgi:pyridoxamine 5'-phosphate oxidase-like protein